MALKHLVLGLLGQEPSHGYRVAARLAALAGAVRRVESARVYETLGALEREGAIAPAQEPPDARGRRVWQVTDLGRRELDCWLARPVPSADWLRRPLLVRLAIAGTGNAGRAAAARNELDARRRALARLEAAELRGRSGDPAAPTLHAALARADRARERSRLAVEIELLEAWLVLAGESGSFAGPRTGRPRPDGTRVPGASSSPDGRISPPPRTPSRSPTGARFPTAPRSAPASR